MKKIPIIFIGGLLGNSLYRPDTKAYIWRDNLSFYLKPKHKRDATVYHYQENLKIKCEHPVQNFKIIPNILHEKIGSILLSKLEHLYGEKFSTQKESLLKYFLYDWRLSVEEVALELEKIIDNQPTIFICQSNGGIVLLHLKNLLQEKLKIKASFFISPPFYGSFESFRFMMEDFFISKNLKLFDKQEVQSFNVCWELLPYQKQKEFLDIDFWLNLKQLALNKNFKDKNILENLIKRSYTFQKSLNPEALSNNNFPVYIYGSNYYKCLNQLLIKNNTFDFKASHNDWKIGDNHNSLDDFRKILNIETLDENYISNKGFIFINQTSENHRKLIASKSVVNSIFNNIKAMQQG